MKAVQINNYGGTEVIEINENAPRPTLGKDQILVEVYAASINPVDFGVIAGRMKDMIPLKFPITIGGNFSGVLVEAGKDTTGFKVGDEVYGQALVTNGGSGSMAELAASNIGNSALKPKKTNHEEAASLPLVGVSAIQALEQHIKLQKDQKILIHGGAGGIGSLAIQLAKHIGAYVATTVGSDSVEFANNLGADKIIDYTKETFEGELSDYDAVFNTARGDSADKSFEVLKKGGVLVSMTGAPNSDLAKKYEVQAIGQMTNTNTENLNRLTELVDGDILKPQIDKIFPLSQAKEGFEYQENQSPKGKIVIKIK